MAPAATGEAFLIRQCAPLYGSFALESLSSLILSILFTYLAFIILCRHRLQSPGLAVIRLIRESVLENVKDFLAMATTWHKMAGLPLESRFAFCRKMNISVCVFSAFVSGISITRWLHVGNVNGFRYLGYALTCPIMQAELVVLAAPVIPCYRLSVILVAAVTFLTMVSGYAGSLYAGDLWTGSFELFMQTWDLDDLKPETKLWAVSPSFIGLGILSVVQLPYLALMYTCRGGIRYKDSNGRIDLPWHYRRLLLLVGVTWLAFPLWWMISSEGMSIISDTKMNGFGFTFLNILSKGSFTFQMLHMVRWHKTQVGRRPSYEEVAASIEEPWYVTLLKPYDTWEFGDPPLSPRGIFPKATTEEVADVTKVAKAVDKMSSWSFLPEDYRFFLESAGVDQDEFDNLDVADKVNIKIRYVEAYEKLKEHSWSSEITMPSVWDVTTTAVI